VAASSHSCATLLQRLLEGVEVLLGERAAGRHRVAAELRSTPGWRLLTRSSASRRWKPAIERPEPFSSRRAEREHEGRAVQAVFQAARDDADHALVEGGIEQRHRGRRQHAVVHEVLEQRMGLLLHAGLHLAPLAVDAVELLRKLRRARRVVGAQAFDAERHVGEDGRPR
jgi:hypothetical protein